MNLIFDFDGTLADSLDINIMIFNKFLKLFGKPLTDKNEILDGGLDKLIKSRSIKKWQIPFLVLMGRFETAKHIHEIKIFPGIRQVLDILSQTHTLGIITSNSKKNVLKFLKNNKIDKNIFTFIDAEFSVTSKHIKIQNIVSKYKLEHQKTWYIADETRDMKAANKAKIKSVAVTWGYESSSSLAKNNTDKTINKPQQLLSVF